MAGRLFSLACLVILFLATVSALEDSVAEKLQQHIDRLDAKIAKMEEMHQLREAELVMKIDQLETRVNSLEAKNAALTKTNYRFREKTRKQFLQESQKTTPGNVRKTDNAYERKALSKFRPRRADARDLDVLNSKRALDRTLNVAFSAYLDHDEDGLGPKETLIFNQILLNEGNGYNNYTGVFTVPITGVYSFTFFIGQRNINQLYTGLYVNNVNKVDAVAQTDNSAEDAQGGNSVLLKASAGEVVYVRKMTYGSHVEGDVSYRLTSFSGFLVYPTEDEPAVVGK